METSHIVVLVLSCAISFGVGRLIVHFRNKKRTRLAREHNAETLRNRPPEKESLNRSKRRRQLQQLHKNGEPR